MNIISYPSDVAVKNAIENDEPLMAVISFDGETAIISHIDDAVGDNILLEKAGFESTDIDKYFRIIFDHDGADWTFICPPDYKNISYKKKRIETFYEDGFEIISGFLKEIGYLVGLNIPKRYRRHITSMNDDTTE